MSMVNRRVDVPVLPPIRKGNGWAETKDWQWFFQRIEEPSHPWGLWHIPTGTFICRFSTLKFARECATRITWEQVLRFRQNGVCW